MNDMSPERALSRPPGLELRRIRFFASIVPAGSALVAGGIAGFAANTSLRIFFAAVFFVSVLAALRGLRLDLLLDRRGVVVRNYWRTYELEWSDVEGVRLGLMQVGIGLQKAIAFYLPDRVVLVQATPIRSSSQAKAFEVIAKLAPPSVPVGPDARRER